MSPMRSKLATALLLSTIASPAAVGSQPAGDPHADLVRVSVVSESTGIAPGGTAWIGIHFEIKQGWHTYWPGQNDSGLGTQIDTKLPVGFTVGTVLWPAPHRSLAPGDILDHVHEGSVTALLPITAPADAQPGGTAQFSFDLAWLVCDEVCIPGWETLTFAMPIVALPEPKAGAAAKIFARARARIPHEAGPDAPFKIEWAGQTAVVRSVGAKKLSFYPDEGGSPVTNLSTAGISSSGVLRLDFDSPEPVLSGVLEFHGSGDASELFVVRSVRDSED
jgi:DsbC/DsbD-like thiol-disulfide interchange protein